HRAAIEHACAKVCSAAGETRSERPGVCRRLSLIAFLSFLPPACSSYFLSHAISPLLAFSLSGLILGRVRWSRHHFLGLSWVGSLGSDPLQGHDAPRLPRRGL